MDEYDNKEPKTYYCHYCDMPVRDDLDVYDIGGKWACEECFRDYITNNYFTDELADELGFAHRKAAEAIEDER